MSKLNKNVFHYSWYTVLEVDLGTLVCCHGVSWDFRCIGKLLFLYWLMKLCSRCFGDATHNHIWAHTHRGIPCEMSIAAVWKLASLALQNKAVIWNENPGTMKPFIGFSCTSILVWSHRNPVLTCSLYSLTSSTILDDKTQMQEGQLLVSESYKILL